MNISLSEYFPDGILNLNVERNSSLLPDPEDGRQEEQELNGANLHPSMIVLLVVALATISTIIALLVIKWHRQRFQQCNWASGTKRKSFFIYCARHICKSFVCLMIVWRLGRSGPAQQMSIRTFSNPNYSPSTPDVVVAEKKSFSWQRWKYDRNQDRVYGMQVRLGLLH